MRIFAKERFDRESEFPGKRIPIPVDVRDREGKENSRIVYVIIGDKVKLFVGFIHFCNVVVSE